MSVDIRSDIEVAKAGVCEETADFFAPDAREALGRAAAGFLLPHSLTPTELLHSTQFQRQMVNAGTNAMQAVQKAASWQVRGMQVPVSERIRRLWDLTDSLQKEVAERLEADPPKVQTPDTLPDLLVKRDGESVTDHRFRVLAALTKTLEDKTGWEAKFATLAELGMGVAGLQAFAPFDAMIAELITPPAALDAILGREETVGDDILRLLALVDGSAKPDVAPREPAQARALYEVLFRGHAPATRQALARHAVRLARSNDKFTRRPLADEIGFIVELRQRLTVDGALMGGQETLEALERRLARALSDQTIDMLMAGTQSVGERVLRAATLHSRIFGEEPKKYLETYIAELMGQPKLETKIVPEGSSARQSVRLLGRIHQAVSDADLAEKTRERIAGQIEGFQATLLDRTRLLEKLTEGSGGLATSDRLLKVIELCRQQAFIEGPNLSRARKAAQDLMKRPDFLDSYLADANQKGERAARLKELQKMLAEARIV